MGGATTSRAHTAVKIDEHYSGPVVHVPDASLAVGVLSQLKNDGKQYWGDIKTKYADIRAEHKAKLASKDELQLPLGKVREQSYKLDLSKVAPQPEQVGAVKVLKVSVKELIPYIDWSPLFWTWELKGKYPNIFEHPKYGVQARELFAEAEKMLETFKADENIQAKAVYGIFPAASQGDDVLVFAGQTRETELARLHFLRQQEKKDNGSSYLCLADFIAPKGEAVDHIGAFVVSMGDGVEMLAKEYRSQRDDFSAILAQAMGDRMAEALAEWLHEKVRRAWGIEHGPQVPINDLLEEEYQGIRPAPGYAACPDHSEKATIWRLLNAEGNIGARLTESFAMMPPSSVSGLYFAHPSAKYFTVGPIGRDQLEDYAKRKSWSVAVAEKWLRPNLS